MKLVVKEDDGGVTVRFAGAIDEKFDPAELIAVGRRGMLILDLDGVEQITSFGIRQWQKALRGLEASYYCFIRCRSSFSWQFNLIGNFAGRGELVSLYAPYLCRSCRHFQELLIDLRRDYERVLALDVPKAPCERCGSDDMELDDVAESYFAYVRGAPRPSPPPLLSRLIGGDGDAVGRLRVTKDVEGVVTGLWLAGTLSGSASFRRLGDGLEGEVVVVAEGVDAVTDEGVASLLQFVDTAPVPIYLARIPPPLWQALAAHAGRVHVVSAMLPFRCESSCAREVNVAVGADAVERLRGGSPVRCHRCLALLAPRFDPSVIEMAKALAFRAPSVAAEGYLRSLRSRRDGDEPTHEAAASIGTYQLLRRIAHGGMGELFLARRIGPAGFVKEVALKLMHRRHLGERPLLELFLKEARVAARLSHPNIVQIFDLGQKDDEYFIAMEYVRGVDLRRLLKAQSDPLAFADVLTIMSDVCAGLHAAHSHRDNDGNLAPIIHRDVSPDNILLSVDGVVKLADFGIAKTAEDGAELNSRQGKVAYLPPEVLQHGSVRHDVRGDVYTVGVVLYECLAMRHPFDQPNDGATMAAAIKGEVEPISSCRPDVSPRLEAVVHRALAQDPDQRFPSAADLRQAIDEVLALDYGGRSPAKNLAALLEDHELLESAQADLDPTRLTMLTVPNIETDDSLELGQAAAERVATSRER